MRNQSRKGTKQYTDSSSRTLSLDVLRQLIDSVPRVDAPRRIEYVTYEEMNDIFREGKVLSMEMKPLPFGGVARPPYTFVVMHETQEEEFVRRFPYAINAKKDRKDVEEGNE